MRVCVYCGSNFGSKPVFREVAEEVGGLLAGRGLGLVYGGGSVGLMGTVADATLAGNGEVIGVIPHKLVELEKEHRGLTKLIEVETMHERKRLMMDHADGFLVLPGGYGTLEELFEVVAWLQLGFHTKPVCLLNVEGYYDPMLVMLDRMVEGGLLLPEHRALMNVAATAVEAVDLLEELMGEGGGKREKVGKWL
ncbi:TIGR00730 family Rossman fold protein [Phragmitibacter flavus]|uniref:Cytokinin riboside 5'-monophosphate phosphoribohydrolase n=1 Tax=Phragmitibacter flavus TaxID=2576071 RepID=A0A5R8KI53_9BACT|nr:TIGR00730 family Rossman fold protein [Phragmitibacter flavus]TLD71920.1 TIGR00730 family Rossman fold protein [Phragmitibacter flavus]